MRKLYEWASKYGWTIFVVAHSGKDESKGIRGWSGTDGYIDLSLHVKLNKANGVVTVTTKKDRNNVAGRDKQFRLEYRTIERNGKTLETSVLLPDESKSKAVDAETIIDLLEDNEQMTFGEIRDALGKDDKTVSRWLKRLQDDGEIVKNDRHYELAG